MSDPTRHAFGMNAEGAWECAYCGSVNDEDRNPCPRLAPSPSRDQGTSDAQIAEWERLANEATPGPWRTEGPGNGWGDHVNIEAAATDGVGVVHAWSTAEWRRDAAFIAAAREAVPALIALVRSERSRATEAERERDAFRATYDAVNDVLLSGSPRAYNPTADRVQANLTRLLKRAESAEADLRSTAGRLAAAERRAEAAEARERALLDFLDAEQKGKRDHILAALAAASPSRKGDATHG